MGENPLNGNGSVPIYMGKDIVSTSGERPEKFIRELCRLTTYMKTTTDSTIISFDAWYHFVMAKVKDIDMHVKHIRGDISSIVKRDEWGELPKRKMCDIAEEEYDYDFLTDDVTIKKRLREMCSIESQDMLKYAIINIIAYICSDLIVDYLREYTKLTGSYVEGVKCRMVINLSHLILVTV